MPRLATRPRPNAATVETAIDRIRRRHRHDDHHLDDGDAAGVLAYLRKLGHTELRGGPAGTHDITDAAILANALHWQALEAERWTIRGGERLGLNRLRTASMFGLAAGQALLDRLRRLDDRLDPRTTGDADLEAAPPTVAGNQADALRELARHLIRQASTWYTDATADDIVVDPEYLAAAIDRPDLRATLALLVAELDAGDRHWPDDLDDDARGALEAATPALRRR